MSRRPPLLKHDFVAALAEAPTCEQCPTCRTNQRDVQRLGAQLEAAREQLADAERSIRALRAGEAHFKALYEALLEAKP